MFPVVKELVTTSSVLCTGLHKTASNYWPELGPSGGLIGFGIQANPGCWQTVFPVAVRTSALVTSVAPSSLESMALSVGSSHVSAAQSQEGRECEPASEVVLI